MWVEAENESFNAEFIQNNILVMGVSIYTQNYKIISFAGLPFSGIFTLNKPNSSRNVFRGF
jgi:hypothetical protein